MRTLFILFSCMILFVGCRNELCMLDSGHNGQVVIKTDWTDTKGPVKGIIAVFYPVINSVDTGKDFYTGAPIYHFLSSDGGRVYLPKGRFRAVVFNDYTENILFRGMDAYETAEAYLGDFTKAPFSTRHPETKAISQPDDFYIDQIAEFVVNDETSEYEIMVKPKLSVITLNIEVKVDGIKNVALARGSLSGIAESVFLSTGKGTLNQVANVLFDFKLTPTGLSAKVKCFGILYDVNKFNILELAFLLKDGSEHKGDFNFNITEIITEDIRQNGGTIHLEHLDIVIPEVPDSGSGDGGFDADVNDWGENIDIELPT